MTFDEIVDVVCLCNYPEYAFHVERDGRGEMYLQAEYYEADTVTRDPMRQMTRRWFLSPKMTHSEIAQTAFKCIMTSMEHRAREWFTYKGRPVYGPHFNVEALVAICDANKFEERGWRWK